MTTLSHKPIVCFLPVLGAVKLSQASRISSRSSCRLVPGCRPHPLSAASLNLLFELCFLPHFPHFLHMEGYNILCKCPWMLCYISLQIALYSKLLPTPQADPKTSECFDHLNQRSTSGQILNIFGFVDHMVSVPSIQFFHCIPKTNEGACVQLNFTYKNRWPVCGSPFADSQRKSSPRWTISFMFPFQTVSNCSHLIGKNIWISFEIVFSFFTNYTGTQSR